MIQTFIIALAIIAASAAGVFLWRRLWPTSPKPYRMLKVEGSSPAKPIPRMLYILTEDGAPWFASMLCPCGCGTMIELNLLPDERPCWRYSVDSAGRPSLEPSVWRKIGCQSHFFLRRGQIVWADDHVSAGQSHAR